MTNDSRTSEAHVVTERDSSFTRSRAIRWLLTAATAAGLAIDAYLHWELAPNYDSLVGSTSLSISQGQLFRVEAVSALIALLLLLATRRRFAAAMAFLVAAGGLGLLLLYHYVNVGDIGPLPNMYDPIWYPDKTITAVSEGVAAAGALCLLLLRDRHPAR